MKDIAFDRGLIRSPMLSPQHGRVFFEANIGPIGRVVRALQDDAPKLAAFRADIEALVTTYFEDNYMRQDFLVSRATKI